MLNIQKEKEEEFKLQNKVYIIGFFVISILGTVLHFWYEYSNNNIVIAIFSAVNESVWEHIKIAVMPMFLWTFIEFITFKYKKPNLWSSLLIKLLTIIIVIPFLYYLYISICGGHILYIDILIFYFAILLAQILGYKEVNSKKINVKYEEIAKYLIIIIFLMFVIFTFIPPKIDLFKDEVTSTYGVFELSY